MSRFFRWRHNRPAKPRGKSQWQTYLRIQSFDYLLHVWHCLCDFYPFLFLTGCEFYFLFLNLILPFSIGGIFFIMPYNCGNLRRIWQNPNSFVLLSPTQNLRYFLHSTNFLQSTTVLLLHREVYHSKQGLSSLGSTMVNTLIGKFLSLTHTHTCDIHLISLEISLHVCNNLIITILVPLKSNTT